jgi:hypothetical protein
VVAIAIFKKIKTLSIDETIETWKTLPLFKAKQTTEILLLSVIKRDTERLL